MKKILITGGAGDLATAINESLKDNFQIFTPSRNELDVASISSVKKYFYKKKFDVVINNAGTLYSSLVVESDPELWIRDIKVNLIGTYLISKYALLNNKDTLLINISSTAAYSSYKDWTSYCASKAGVLKLSEGLSLDGYDVITLCPGAIETKMRDGLNIPNSNIMSVDEGVKPIVDSILGVYKSGSIIFYRKNELKIL